MAFIDQRALVGKMIDGSMGRKVLQGVGIAAAHPEYIGILRRCRKRHLHLIKYESGIGRGRVTIQRSCKGAAEYISQRVGLMAW